MQPGCARCVMLTTLALTVVSHVYTGIPNTSNFHNITGVKDALALWDRIKGQKEKESFNPANDEEYEDAHGAPAAIHRITQSLNYRSFQATCSTKRRTKISSARASFDEFLCLRHDTVQVQRMRALRRCQPLI